MSRNARSIDISIDHVLELTRILLKDTETALDQAASHKDGYSRRNAFRSAFADIEGSISLLKDSMLQLHENGKESLTPAEYCLVKEEAYQVDGRGDITSRAIMIRVADNLLFAWKIYFRSILPEFSPDLSGKGWASFKSALLVRNRITHPKTLSDLEVSDQDMIDLVEGYKWVNQTTSQNMARALIKLRGKFYEDLNQNLGLDVLQWINQFVASNTLTVGDYVTCMVVQAVPDKIFRELASYGLMTGGKDSQKITSQGLLYFKFRQKVSQLDA